METINDLQIEVTQIVVKKHSLLNRRDIFEFKRRLFISHIVSITEENYLVNNNYSKCSCIITSDEEIKVKEPYNELAELHSAWFKESVESSEAHDKQINN